MNRFAHPSTSIGKIRYRSGNDVFLGELKQRVNAYFQESGLSRQDDPRMYLKTAIQIVIWLVSYTLLLSNWFQGWMVFGLQVVFHFSMFLMSVGIAHDGSHQAYSKHRWLNRLTYRVFDLIGINSHMWEYNHNRSHHYMPNIPMYDSAIDSFGLFRFHPKAPYRWFHRYQHIYIFGIYALATLFKLFFLDFFSHFRKQIGMIQPARHGLSKFLYLLITKSIVIFYTLMIPLIVVQVPGWQIIAGFIAGHMVSGVALGLIFQVTHLSDHSVFPEPDSQGEIKTTFSEHILVTTTDFCVSNRMITWISGGLNIHVAHHLLPRISQVHLPAIAQIVKELASKHELPYKEYFTIGSALASHLRLLRKLGSKDSLTYSFSVNRCN